MIATIINNRNRFPSATLVVHGDWILEFNIWNDSGIWKDASNWED